MAAVKVATDTSLCTEKLLGSSYRLDMCVTSPYVTCSAAQQMPVNSLHGLGREYQRGDISALKSPILLPAFDVGAR